MRLLFTSTLVACALFLNAQIENGCISIDFESFPNETPVSGLVLSDQYKDAFGLSFRLEGGGFPVLAQVGGDPAEAFGSAWGSDTPAPGVDIGQFFLTDDGQLAGLTSPPIILDFEIPIDSFAGCILDMDFQEFFIIQALDDLGNVILEERIDAGDPGTGDGELTCWGFNLPGCEGSIYSIKYAGFRPASSPGAFGLGMDYFSFCYSGLQIDTETTPVTCNELGSINIFSTTNEVYEYSLDGIDYSTNGFFDQLGEGIQTIYVRDSEDCVTTVDVNVELEAEDLPDPIFVEEEICEGQSFSFNGEEYTDSGMYQQTLNAANGCDTLWNLTLTVNPNSSEIIDAQICDGETFDLNGESYSTSGTFEQKLNTSEDCDSTIVINLIVNPNTEENIFAQICDGESFGINGEVYTSSGMYSQQLTNQYGCDSLLNLELEVFELTEETISAQICEGDDVTINDVVYDAAGSYSQTLINSEGCDSLLDIRIDLLPVIETCESVSIFEGEVFNLNGEEYSVEGTYEQMLQTVDGCDSLVIIKLSVFPLPVALVHYDMNDCSAAGSSYSEFLPRYEEELECGQIMASILNRPSGLAHSCTPGEIGSGMCVSSDPSCSYEEDSEHRMVFDVFVNPTNGPVSIEGLRFFEKAPINYEFNVGNTGPNNYPTLYSLKIIKNADVIYFDESISTNREWTLQSFSFNGLDEFVFEEPGNLRVEFLAYCPTGISSHVSAWDIDELSLFGFCRPDNNKVTGNVMTTKAEPLSEVTIAVNKDESWEYYASDADGEFAFETDYDQTSVLVEPRYDFDVLNGVTTLDLILIQRHILGLQRFDEFTNLVAADINKDDKIDAQDLLQLRRLILGIYESFPQNTSWRFIDSRKKYDELSDLTDRMIIGTLDEEINLEGIKVGDINQSYLLTANETELDYRTQSSFKLVTREYRNDTGELIVAFYATEDLDLSGLQATFNIGNNNALKLNSRKITLDESNYHLKNGELKMSWLSQGQEIKRGELLFEMALGENQNGNPIQLESNARNEIYSSSDLRAQSLVLEYENEVDFLDNIEAVQLNVNPNPFRDATKVQFVSKEKFETKYEIIDISGRLIKSKSIQLETGINEVDLNRNEFPGSGIYFIRVNHNQSVFIKRVVLL